MFTINSSSIYKWYGKNIVTNVKNNIKSLKTVDISSKEVVKGSSKLPINNELIGLYGTETTIRHTDVIH